MRPSIEFGSLKSRDTFAYGEGRKEGSLNEGETDGARRRRLALRPSIHPPASSRRGDRAAPVLLPRIRRRRERGRRRRHRPSEARVRRACVRTGSAQQSANSMFNASSLLPCSIHDGVHVDGEEEGEERCHATSPPSCESPYYVCRAALQELQPGNERAAESPMPQPPRTQDFGPGRDVQSQSDSGGGDGLRALLVDRQGGTRGRPTTQEAGGASIGSLA